MSHSFITTSFVTKYEMKSVATCELNVTTPTGESVSCKTLYLDIPIYIAGTELPANLIQFDLKDFYVILGMNWLSKYKARIECLNQKVLLRGPRGNRISYRGVVSKFEIRIVSAIVFQGYVRKGYPIYLCHVHDMNTEEKEIKNIRVVNEFEDVFLEEILGMSPVREMEFKIDLVLALVEKTPISNVFFGLLVTYFGRY
ncbi:Proline--tRNA ligase [Bienertia sinuspersici]